ncbi:MULTISPECIES: sensor domain-containing diguanylate cyclase [Bacillaceae]|uniref:sensor domain-containing diguanylate cyclase n=1 Tax=Bacillaceae TaxID=186817 RepID=UPI001E4D3D50|nr:MULTISPECIES: sensor domain-containing diguanylate cyclase [Bacillaceae]UGB29696.1 sensor domain-containing diguanylate cyclase [Metabacillus sp. B2-18]
MNKKVQALIWATWIILSPILLWISYQMSPPTIKGLEIDLISFLVLMCLVAFFPIIINDTPVFYIQGVSLVVFLYFGLFVEIIFTQIAVIVLLSKLRLRRKDLYRVPLNSLLFLSISIIGAIVYYLVGGTHGRNGYSAHFLSAIIAYEATIFLSNQLLLNAIKSLLFKEKFDILTKSFLWEFVTSIIVFPFAVALYFLYFEVGISSILFIGIPLLTLSIILTLYYKSKQINHYLQQASEIGHQLTERLQKNEVLNIFIEKITKMIPVEAAYIIDVYDQEKLKIVREFESGFIQLKPETNKSTKKGISGYVYAMRESVLFHSRAQWKNIQHSQLPESVESVIGVPVKRNQDLVGIVILASNKKRAFDRTQLMLIDLLSTYLGVAIENARNYEKTKKQSEHCALTGLYNYRFIENELQKEFELISSQENKSLSIILIDLDHFKSVNDTYGHHAGNEVLIELANRIVEAVGGNGTVARYGGEEFVVLLPGYSNKDSLQIAEELRQKIANIPFIIESTLQNSNHTQALFVTASFGVATAPNDADDPLSLIRHADRAMYIGAKRAGRNRVAGYVS